MGIIYDKNNHDTTCSVYLPLQVTSDEVRLNENEFADTRFLPTDEDSLEEFLHTEGGSLGGRAVGHCLGDVELYLENLRAGLIN